MPKKNNTFSKLMSTFEKFKQQFAFAVEKKSVESGKKTTDFETYNVRDLSLGTEANYLRVTSPLGYWVPPTLKSYFQNNTKEDQDEKLKTAGLVGHAVHAYIEDFFSSHAQLPEVFVEQYQEKHRSEILNSIKAFIDFWASEGLTPLQQEFSIFSKKFGFAGTIDMIAIKDQKIYIVDWKSGRYSPSFGWQLAAYGLAFYEHFGIEPKLLAVRIDKKTGKPFKIQYEHNSHLEACYLGVLQAFAGHNWRALGKFWPWHLNEFHQTPRRNAA